MFKNSAKIYLLIIGLVLSNSANASKNNNISFADTIEKVTPTVVTIATSQKTLNSENELANLLKQIPKGSPFEKIFKDLLKNQQPAETSKKKNTLGSGFIISKEGHIVTNNHVIQDADEIEVTFSDGESAKASVIGRDPKSDIALIKVETEKKLTPVKFGDSDKMRVGDWSIAIGNPFGLGGSVTAGIISARERDISDSGIVEYFQTDTAINRGNSGGPLFNINGELIGITTAIFSTDGSNIGIGFAIPSNPARSIIDQLKNSGQVTRGWLGVHVQDITEDIASALDLSTQNGAYVVHVTKGSPADQAGLQIDDIIIEFDGFSIDKTSQLPRIVGNTAVNKTVVLKILRREAGRNLVRRLNVKVQKFAQETPDNANDIDNNVQNEAHNVLLGLHLIELARVRNYYSYSDVTDGLVVLLTEKGSLADAKGVEAGDLIQKVNQKPVFRLSDIRNEIRTAQKNNNKNVLITLLRNGSISVFTLDIPPLDENAPDIEEVEEEVAKTE